MLQQILWGVLPVALVVLGFVLAHWRMEKSDSDLYAFLGLVTGLISAVCVAVSAFVSAAFILAAVCIIEAVVVLGVVVLMLGVKSGKLAGGPMTGYR